MNEDFDGCTRDCRTAGRHTLVWGRCELAEPPEPTVSMSRVYADTDGGQSIGFDVYTADELAQKVIGPALQGIRVAFGPEMIEAITRGAPVLPFEDEDDAVQVGRWIAREIIRRNDPPGRIPIPGIPECGSGCTCRTK